jgi:hypothetical protein
MSSLTVSQEEWNRIFGEVGIECVQLRMSFEEPDSCINYDKKFLENLKANIPFMNFVIAQVGDH